MGDGLGDRLLDVSLEAQYVAGVTPLVGWLGLLLGGKVDRREDRFGYSRLHRAAKSCNKNFAKWLLRRGASAELRSFADLTPLMVAASSGCHEVAQILIDRGADMDARDSQDSRAPLHMAAEAGSLPTVGLLLSRGADPNATDSKDLTALDYAAASCSLAVVKKLVEDSKADGYLELHRQSAVEIAAEANCPKAMAVLFDKFRLKPSQALFGQALESCRVDSVSFMLARDKSLATTPLSSPPLHSLTCLPCLKPLLASGASPSQTDNEGNNAFHSLSALCQTPVLSALLPSSPSEALEAVNGLGETPLVTALRSSCPAAAAALMRGGASVNPATLPADKMGPLHWAAQQCSQELVTSLLAKGADKEALNDAGLTPRALAAMNNCFVLSRYL
eukprot:gnl/Hemi2/12278_TR4200_c0_g1_i1.p1 gnl/Hemi2/12278_TR4200_c0_g1~~gnl/Hemi2/12278_TR4200_c0_g1_i1.p1  ORF type:complete len:391 (+),score=108.20 gnl/Hemi2/12278_TR4200_c0_g1_i1:169-1341(+)